MPRCRLAEGFTCAEGRLAGAGGVGEGDLTGEPVGRRLHGSRRGGGVGAGDPTGVPGVGGRLHGSRRGGGVGAGDRTGVPGVGRLHGSRGGGDVGAGDRTGVPGVGRIHGPRGGGGEKGGNPTGVSGVGGRLHGSPLLHAWIQSLIPAPSVVRVLERTFCRTDPISTTSSKSM